MHIDKISPQSCVSSWGKSPHPQRDFWLSMFSKEMDLGQRLKSGLTDFSQNGNGNVNSENGHISVECKCSDESILASLFIPMIDI